MPDRDHRSVSIERVDTGVYLARNSRGNELRFGSRDEEGFSPVELLLAAIAGCTAVDVDVVTARRAAPEVFESTVEAAYVRDEDGNRLEDITLTLRVAFPPGPDGELARTLASRALQVSHDRTCTVSRTIERGTPVMVRLEG